MKQAILFIDQDGTLVKEPPVDYQLDAWEKLEFTPKAISNLAKIAERKDYVLVLVSNQDGLGRPQFPEQPFLNMHQHILKTFANEGVVFQDVFIDRSLPEENADTRKPGTAMLGKYLDADNYDLENSYVIGDRYSDMQLANNIGCKGIYLKSPDAYKPNADEEAMLEQANPEFRFDNWDDVASVLLAGKRKSEVSRNTKETEIGIQLNMDGSGQSSISTGLHFFDHMLEQIAKHALVDLNIAVKGDLQVDEHHTIEDTALALGEAFAMAIGSKLGLERYGYALPMDDCLAQVALDFGGRPWLVWEADFKREKIGDMPTEMFMHFFKSFSDAAKCNLNIKAEGNNEHHKIEGIFKAFAKSIKMAKKRDVDNMVLPSSKGVL
jgi:imidazoleglycerol-phosphate dehydratase/histidinol-phosphatase